MFLVRPFIGILVCLLICGCGGNSTSPGPTLNLTAGNWNVIGASTVGGGFTGGSSLSQTGANVSGIMHLLGPPCFNLIPPLGLSGTVSGPTLNLTSAAVNGQTLSVRATGSDRLLTGTYTLSAAACGPADQGAVTATLVPPATGTWHGTLTSLNGPVTQVTATLTQSGPDAQGIFSVSGPVTFSGTCLPSGTVSGSLVNGGLFLVIVQPNDPGVSGNVRISGAMTDPATATAFSGVYISSAGGCVDNGQATMNKS